MKNEKRTSFGNVTTQNRFKILVCILMLFFISTAFLVPHNVYAQEIEEGNNNALVHKDEQHEPNKDDGSGGLVDIGTAPQPDGAICRFRMEGDYVHISIGDASGHGWWVNIDCEAMQAIVTVQLQQYINGSWQNAGSPGSKTVYSGGGSANRAVGRAHCNTTTTTSWRSVIDVDVIGILDSPFKYYTPTQSLNCRH
jgi:hypothetical protein